MSRRERRALLGISLLGVAVVFGNLVPSEIESFGLHIEHPNQAALLWLLALVVCYFLAAFCFYAYSDYLGWRLALSEARIAAAREQDEYDDLLVHGHDPDGDVSETLSEAYTDRGHWWRRAPRVSVARAIIDFALPIGFALFAAAALVWRAAS